MQDKIKVVTHSGIFHADDIFAVATLLLHLDNKEVIVVRSREKSIIESGDYVVDVGLVYNENKNMFDHHQLGGAGVRANGIAYASFGLVWKKFGLDLCKNVSEVFEKIDQILVQPVDATDNGFKLVDTRVPNVYPYDIGLFFNTFNPGFDESVEDTDNRFMEAVVIAKNVLAREINKRVSLFSVKKIIDDIYKNAKDKRLIVLDKFFPISDFLSGYPEPLFVVYPGINGNWNIKSISDDPNTFENRKYLPQEWAGKTGTELENITSVKGAIFCHTQRFIAVAETKEAILKMAEIALNS